MVLLGLMASFGWTVGGAATLCIQPHGLGYLFSPGPTSPLTWPAPCGALFSAETGRRAKVRGEGIAVSPLEARRVCASQSHRLSHVSSRASKALSGPNSYLQMQKVRFMDEVGVGLA